ncbi:MAG: hypothetical protein GX443_10960 [Deltaproteobacteria bacterium]|nr:hypothetical protein [Deltaproteobacteria bacterium]
MEVQDVKSFFEDHKEKLFYVGILKSSQSWFPFCVVSDPDETGSLDTLPVSRSYQSIVEVVEEYARRIPHVEVSFVHYMNREEILRLIEDYGLKHVGLIDADGDGLRCGCGCGCG